MADKTRTIKNATDQELNELIVRLRKEAEVQSLIAEIRRKSTPNDPHNQYNDYRPEISTEQPIESLYHYGIPGMRWGIRRKRGRDGRIIRGSIGARLSGSALRMGNSIKNLRSRDYTKTARFAKNTAKGVALGAALLIAGDILERRYILR